MNLYQNEIKYGRRKIKVKSNLDQINYEKIKEYNKIKKIEYGRKVKVYSY